MRAPWRRRSVLQRDGAAMLLDALLHDGEAKTRAFLVSLGGHVRLEQAGTVVLGQPGTVVDHLDIHAVAVAAYNRLDAAAPAGLLVGALGVALDRLFRVLHQ